MRMTHACRVNHDYEEISLLIFTRILDVLPPSSYISENKNRKRHASHTYIRILIMKSEGECEGRRKFNATKATEIKCKLKKKR